MLSTVVATIGVLRERAAHERRVALDPPAVQTLVKRGFPVVVESGAGERASFRDTAYIASGATVESRKEVIAHSRVLVVVRSPDPTLVAALTEEQTIIGLLDPFNRLDTVAALVARRVTMIAFELLPRTVTRAQSMDAMSSQASAAGYRAALVAADAFGRYLPMMITASGTATPAKVIVIGTGVAGLQAIATFRRLGAVVTGYDVRSASRPEVESLGATFLTSSVAEGAGTGGYARALTPPERGKLRLGKEGYRKVQSATYLVASYLAEGLRAMGIFDIIFDGDPLLGIPAVTWKLSNSDSAFSVFDLADELRTRGWLVPAYTLPAGQEDVAVQRIIVRHGLSLDMADLVLDDIRRAIGRLTTRPPTRQLLASEAPSFNHDAVPAVSTGMVTS